MTIVESINIYRSNKLAGRLVSHEHARIVDDSILWQLFDR